MKSLLFATLYLVSTSASADILFLNFNRNASSIAAAKKAAAKRGEKVVVYPDEKIKTLDAKTIDAIFKDVTNKKLNITNVLMSGHDGGGSFGGKDGDLSKYDIQKAIGKYPDLKKSVKSLLLRGCYTATMGQVQSQSSSDWRQVFPNLEYIAGYNDPAESSERPESKELVEDMLTLEDEFLNARTLNDVTKTFKKIGMYNQMDAALWMKPCQTCGMDKGGDGIYLTSDMVLAKKGPVSIADERKRCEANQKQLDTHMETYWKYFEGEEKGFERPPKEHHGTKLRDAYSYIRQNEHCIPILYPQKATAYSPDRIIRLIYYDYIVSNFQDKYPSAPIESLIKSMVPANKQAEYKYPDLKTASRKNIKAYISKLEGLATELYHDSKANSAKQAQALKMFKHAQAMSTSVGLLMPFHVPFAWVSEPHSGAPLTGLH